MGRTQRRMSVGQRLNNGGSTARGRHGGRPACASLPLQLRQGCRARGAAGMFKGCGRVLARSCPARSRPPARAHAARPSVIRASGCTQGSDDRPAGDARPLQATTACLRLGPSPRRPEAWDAGCRGRVTMRGCTRQALFNKNSLRPHAGPAAAFEGLASCNGAVGDGTTVIAARRALPSTSGAGSGALSLWPAPLDPPLLSCHL